MSSREIDQVSIMKKIRDDGLTIKKGAEILGFSIRHMGRKYSLFRQFGIEGILHKGRGRPCNRRLPEKQVEKILSLLKTNYQGYGPTLATEEMRRSFKISVDHETVRRLMISSGLWHVRKRRKGKHVWREPKHHAGELVQCDGSFHKWFGDTHTTLMAFIDDATRKVHLKFAAESVIGVATTFTEFMRKFGRPKALYTDCGSVYRVNTHQKEEAPITQFHRMLRDLDIKLIHAYSPQAKGRVERLFRTLQDRLVKALAQENVQSIEQANEFLARYIPQHNLKFGKKPKSDISLYRPLTGYNLNQIMSVQTKRPIYNDRTIKHKKRCYLIEKYQKSFVRINSKVTVHDYFDGTIAIYQKGNRIRFTDITEAATQQPAAQGGELYPWEIAKQNRTFLSSSRQDISKEF